MYIDYIREATSTTSRTIKGPQGKEITRIIENHFSEPVEIKA
ncbi:hypothetical protein ACQKN1_11315 [Staphylococcus capitis]